MNIKNYRNYKKNWKYKNYSWIDLSLDLKILTLSASLTSSGSLFHSWAQERIFVWGLSFLLSPAVFEPCAAQRWRGKDRSPKSIKNFENPVNEWMNTCMHEWLTDWLNEWIRMDGCMHACMHECKGRKITSSLLWFQFIDKRWYFKGKYKLFR